MKTGITILAMATAWGLPAAGRGFTASEVTFWAGSGTNEAVLVVDWQETGTPEGLAWGFRWDGMATARDLIEAVAAADARLSMRLHPGYAGTALFGVGYDADGDGGRFVTGFPLPGRENGYALDPDDRYREGWNSGFWSLWRGAGSPYTEGNWAYSGSGFGSVDLTNGAWVGWGFDDDLSCLFLNGDTNDQPRLPAPAASPYAAGIVAYDPGPDWGTDWVCFTPLTNAASALGRPTVDSTGGGLPISQEDAVPAVPVYPPFRHFEIVTIGTGGELVLAFDHPVEDDPGNPYGVDFIVFGNTLQESTGGAWTNGNPHDVTMDDDLGGNDEGVVSVSQDGTNWFALPSGPPADAFAPTLGRRYDPVNPDAGLGPSNLWWGAPADPRWPLDPSLGPADFAGMTLAGMCGAYGRSAGGTAFDIATTALAPDPATGRKWFRFLRIQSQLWPPEVDAVSDVGPAKGYEGWQLDHFTFWQRTNDLVAGEAADPDGDDCTNLLEYVCGRDPWVDDATPLLGIGTVAESNGTHVIVSYDRRPELIDAVAVVEQTTDFASWSDAGVEQAHTVTAGTGGVVRVEARIPAQGCAAARLRVFRP